MTNSPEEELRDKILKALKMIADPDLGKDIVTLGFVKDVLLKKSLLGKWDVSLTIELTTPACPVKDDFKRQAEELVMAIDGVKAVTVKMTARVRAQGNRGVGGRALPGVKNVVAVGSGKGGVGKSTVAVNLALSLKRMGSHVGLLDADIHGPSLSMMLDLKGGMPEVRNSRIVPRIAYGMPVMTFAFFAPVGDAVIFRGAMTAKAVEQMLFDVDWSGATSAEGARELDYLIVDMPPGTGDVPLTLIHSVRVAGAVVVSTPQAVAWLDAGKGVAMFQKMNVPVLGVVENMAGFLCQHCGKPNDVFGSGGAEEQALKRGVPFLGRIPLDPIVTHGGDRGTPIVVTDPDHAVSLAFATISQKTAQRLSIEALKDVSPGT